MGAWGVGILDDDSARDIIGEYSILLAYGLSNEAAYETIKVRFYKEFVDAQLEDIYWLAIAIFQWKNGILMHQVKNKALSYIEDPKYLEVWKESGEKVYQKRKEKLDDLKQKLLGPSNKPKRVAKPPLYMRKKTCLEVGDLLAHKLCCDAVSKSVMYNKWVLLRVIKIKKRPISLLRPDLDYESYPCLGLYNWYGDNLPDKSVICDFEFTPIVSYLFDEYVRYGLLLTLDETVTIKFMDKDPSLVEKMPLIYMEEDLSNGPLFEIEFEMLLDDTFKVLEGRAHPTIVLTKKGLSNNT